MGLQPSPRWQTSLKIQELPKGQPRADIPGVLTVAFATLWGSPHTLLGLFFDLLCYQILFPSAQPSLYSILCPKAGERSEQWGGGRYTLRGGLQHPIVVQGRPQGLEPQPGKLLCLPTCCFSEGMEKAQAGVLCCCCF